MFVSRIGPVPLKSLAACSRDRTSPHGLFCCGQTFFPLSLPPEYVSKNGSITSALPVYPPVGLPSLTFADVKIKGDGLFMLFG